jgi:phosphoribosylamine---glycine ligase
MTILLLGAGGREHALAWKLRQSPRCGVLYCAPGNPGTSRAGATNVPDLNPVDPAAVVAFVRAQRIDLVVIGPEAPLVAGVTDALRAEADLKHVIVVGPGAAGARLEGSKAWSKGFMERNGIPTAPFRAFTVAEAEEARAYVRQHSLPVVLKADGLAQGKGVVVAQTTAEAEAALDLMLGGEFGAAGNTVLVEAFLKGQELSAFILTGGEGFVLLPTAQDYKRVGDGDTGPNTGGMGAISPAPAADEPFMQRVRNEIIGPTLTGLKAEGILYQGFIFLGLMRVPSATPGDEDEPWVIEYNVRLGDPETQAILPRLQSDLVDLFESMHRRQMAFFALRIDPRPACAVVMASGGYPGAFTTGHVISGVAHAEAQSETLVFHAGTTLDVDHHTLRSAGGRVLAVVARADSAAEAANRAHAAANLIEWEGAFRRSDIGRG